jgi:hypothetical protein
MSIINKYKESIANEISYQFSEGTATHMPDVIEYIRAHKGLYNDLIYAYKQKVAPGYTSISLSELGVREDVALMQSCLWDTILVDEQGRLFTNNAPELLNVPADYQISSDFLLNCNRQGICRAYQIKKGKSSHMSGDVGIVRSQNTFTQGRFYLYSVYRAYMEWLFIWASAKGGVDVGGEFTFTFMKEVGTRFNLKINEWDLNHKKICDDSELVDAHYMLQDKKIGQVKALISTGETRDFSILDKAYVKPISKNDVMISYGRDVAEHYERAMLLNYGIQAESEKKNKNQKCYTEETAITLMPYYKDTGFYHLDFLARYKKDAAFRQLANRFKDATYKPIAKDKDTIHKNLQEGFVLITSKNPLFNGIYTLNEELTASLYGKYWLTRAKKSNFAVKLKEAKDSLAKGAKQEPYHNIVRLQENKQDGSAILKEVLHLQTDPIKNLSVLARNCLTDTALCENLYTYIPLSEIEEVHRVWVSS